VLSPGKIWFCQIEGLDEVWLKEKRWLSGAGIKLSSQRKHHLYENVFLGIGFHCVVTFECEEKESNVIIETKTKTSCYKAGAASQADLDLWHSWLPKGDESTSPFLWGRRWQRPPPAPRTTWQTSPSRTNPTDHRQDKIN